jgi:hypothetical protein
MINRVLSHDETKSILIHATAASSTKEVAELIGTTSSRISEGKDKRWRLPAESEKVLIEAFGPVRAEEGYYFEAEVWNSFEEYKKQSPTVVAKRQLVKIASILNDEVKLCEFLNSVDLKDTTIVDKVELRQVKLDVINELIYHPTFCKWHKFLKSHSHDRHINTNDYLGFLWVHADFLVESSLKEVTRYLRDNRSIKVPDSGSLKEVFTELGISYISSLIPRDSLGPFSSLLYLIGEFTENYQWVSGLFKRPLPANKYFVGTQLNYGEPIQNKPIVLTGNVIWNHECQSFKEPMFFSALNLLPNVVTEGIKTDPYEILRHNSVYKNIYVGPDRYTGASVQLNLTKSMVYHLHFQLGELIANEYLNTNNGRSVVIKDIRPDDVFDLIEDFAEYFKLQMIPMIQIKQEIAKNGGFIPGALVL